MKTRIKLLVVFHLLFINIKTSKSQIVADSIAIPFTITSFKSSFCTDDSVRYWVGLDREGVVYYDGVYFYQINQLSTGGILLSDSIEALDYNSATGVWIGTKYGLNNIQNFSISSYPFNGLAFVTSKINGLASDSQFVYIATDNGLVRFDRSINAFNSFNSVNSAIPSDTIKSVFVEKNGKVWLTSVNGYSCFDGSNFINTNTANSDLPSDWINQIIVTPYDTILKIENYGIIRRIDNHHVDLDSVIWIENYLKAGEFQFCDSAEYLTYFQPQSYQPRTSNLLLSNSQNISFLSNLLGSGNRFSSYFLIDSSKVVQWKPNIGNGFTSLLTTHIPGRPGPFIGISKDSIIAFVNNTNSNKNKGLIFSDNDLIKISFNSNLPFTNAIVKDFSNSIPQSAILGSSADLFSNNVKARLLNRGDLHYDVSSGKAGYEVPSGSLKNTVFASSLWLSGIEQSTGLIHAAAQMYRQNGNDFYPGPLDVNGVSDSSTQSLFDHIWVANKEEIEEFRYQYLAGNVQNGSYTPPAFILSWPAFYSNSNYPQKLAPFVDVNGDNLYKPLIDGDYPEIKGDQMAWCVFNDYGAKDETNSEIMNLEVQLSAYSFKCIDSSLTAKGLNYTTFYHYDLYNRGTKTFNPFYFGMWSDMDLGNGTDDFVACDLPSNSFCFYNSDADDDQDYGGYGNCPPIQNVVLVAAPNAPTNDGIDNNHNGLVDEQNERMGLSSFMCYENINFSPVGNPNTLDDFFEYMTAKWLDGQSLTYGSTGRSSGAPITNFMFPGLSNTSFATTWKMDNSVGSGSDYKAIGTVGPLVFAPNTKTSFDFAFVTGSSDTIENRNLISDLINFSKINSAATLSSVAPPIQGLVNVGTAGAITSYSVTPLIGFAYTFDWSVSGGILLSGQGTSVVTVMWPNNGVGKLSLKMYRPGNGCAMERAINVSVGSSSVNENSKFNNDIILYPNPVTQSLNFKSNSQVAFLSIYAIDGSLVYTGEFISNLDVSKVNSGCYLIQFLDSEKNIMFRTRFIKI